MSRYKRTKTTKETKSIFGQGRTSAADPPKKIFFCFLCRFCPLYLRRDGGGHAGWWTLKKRPSMPGGQPLIFSLRLCASPPKKIFFVSFGAFVLLCCHARKFGILTKYLTLMVSKLAKTPVRINTKTLFRDVFSTPQNKENRDVPMNKLLSVVLPSQPTSR